MATKVTDFLNIMSTYPGSRADSVVSVLYVLQGFCDIRVRAQRLEVGDPLCQLIHHALVVVYVTVE